MSGCKLRIVIIGNRPCKAMSLAISPSTSGFRLLKTARLDDLLPILYSNLPIYRSKAHRVKLVCTELVSWKPTSDCFRCSKTLKFRQVLVTLLWWSCSPVFLFNGFLKKQDVHF